jgi:DNA gyrase/topoisomerase IV subunit A
MKHSADDLPDMASGLTLIERRVLGAVPRDAYTKTTNVLRAVIGKDAPSLEPYLSRDRWADVNLPAGGGEHVAEVVGLAEFAALVRLAQPFYTRYPLIDGNGYFGTVQGDPPADHYYTECRLTPLGVEVLAGRAPNALLNGAPSFLLPHHAADVARVLALVAGHPSTPIEELIGAIVGPDIATGGVIEDAAPLRMIYAGARARIVVRARVEVDDDALVVREIPFGVSTGEVIEQLWHRESVVDDILDDGSRLVLVLRSGVDLARAQASLLHHPLFARTIDVQPIVSVDGETRQVDLSELARGYLERAAPGRDALASLAGLAESPRRTRVG